MTVTRSDAALVHRLGTAWQDAVTAALGSERAALLDFPGHKNVGDSLIWLGERALLARAGVGVDYACEHHSLVPAALRARNGSRPLMLHGGGNFGDVWPDYQRFREDVARRFPRQRIVQLPQSIWYSDSAAGDDTGSDGSRALRAHPDLHLMVRDRRSLDEARRRFPDAAVGLVPDAAFGLGPLERTAPAEVDVLCLMRDDREGVGHAATFRAAGLPVTDWGRHAFDHRAWRLKRRTIGAVRRVETAATSRLTQPVLRATYDAMARQNLQAGVRTFSRARVIVTDRLHGHVLCLLLGIPHVVLDNSYGKIADFREAWTSESVLTRTASGADEAVDAARELLREFGGAEQVRAAG
ncbi:polysaccharide pyruvyl transferase family protein [Kineococcus rhizosphaerae]|uniref:Pyruvyl transferase EpsO n=1 Tax=Kineococcus rhizosphaerae TaxID=559628 RepID=A0A2T0R0X7_9ACTN|nr:polysaccharide pyruvyl transferase family protein [Kineococcus rhizosphaerae]PRY12939.1 pyruvyl transferase EpsO [Kineococcus rhizosphaerae]